MNAAFTMPFAGGALDHVETRRSAEDLKGFVTDKRAQCLVFFQRHASA